MGLGELRFLDWLAKGSTPHARVVVGIGDDAAVVHAGLEEGLVLAAETRVRPPGMTWYPCAVATT